MLTFTAAFVVFVDIFAYILMLFLAWLLLVALFLAWLIATRIRHNIQSFNGVRRIITGNHEFAAFGVTASLVLNYDLEATSTRQPTPPKNVEPVTASFPAGALPETLTVRIPAGSSLLIERVAILAPKLLGWKRIGRSIDAPAATIRGLL